MRRRRKGGVGVFLYKCLAKSSKCSKEEEVEVVVEEKDCISRWYELSTTQCRSALRLRKHVAKGKTQRFINIQGLREMKKERKWWNDEGERI